ncbi:sucrose cleavage family protein [Patellaria atrata CBS 101060]|uniref:Altered inheritance of mitochondria protein 32 n=1 Tax=Patellaria atrata CBS 101060 TaxID=1346257 RepID=A0A9P4S701_9PEZI|nr:sucrose cleavage family protein [Patellaria atrata CBS 101060]
MFIKCSRPLISTVQFSCKRYASRLRIQVPPPFPVIKTCPSPTCECRPMPTGLDIDREQDLNGTMAAYGEHVLISTGKDDWKSRIEDEEIGPGELAREMKKLLGRGGPHSDPYHNVMITNSSFPLSEPFEPADTTVASAFLFPSFRYVPCIPLQGESIRNFVKGFVLPTELHPSYDAVSEEQRAPLLRQQSLQDEFEPMSVNQIVVLICGHGGRDLRCGVMGPLLHDEFEEKLKQQDIQVAYDESSMEDYQAISARVGLISHIGGHKYAGNVIIYIPPSYNDHPLAGKGIWYGRVSPEHVEGIVRTTIIEGKVIKEFFRGGINNDGSILRL